MRLQTLHTDAASPQACSGQGGGPLKLPESWSDELFAQERRAACKACFCLRVKPVHKTRAPSKHEQFQCVVDPDV